MPTLGGPGTRRHQQLRARSAPHGRGSSRQWVQPCRRTGVDPPACTGCHGVPIFPSPPPGAPGMTLFGNRLFAGEIKLGLAHPGLGGALTPKTREKRRREDRQTDRQTAAHEDSRDEPGATSAPRACVGARPCPPLERGPRASSSVKEQGLWLQPPRPCLSSSPRMRVRRPASTHHPLPWVPTRQRCWAVLSPADARTTRGPAPSSVHGILMAD